MYEAIRDAQPFCSGNRRADLGYRDRYGHSSHRHDGDRQYFSNSEDYNRLRL